MLLLLLCCCFVIHCYRPLVHLALAHMVDATLDGTCEQTNTCVLHPFVILRADIRVQSATRWTASVHTLHMSKPVITFVFQVLRDGLPRYILYTCLQPVITFVFKMLCDGLPRYILYTCLQPVITFVFKMLCDGLPRYILYTCPNL